VQISSTTRAPTAPGNGGFVNPARVWPQRAQLTVSGTRWPTCAR